MSPVGAGGCTADLPSTIRITFALSSLGVMSPPVEMPPSRQWIVRPAGTSPNPADMNSICGQVGRERLESGPRRSNGIRMKVSKLASLLISACMHLLIALAARDVALGRVEQRSSARVSRSAPARPFMMLPALAKRQPGQRAQRAAVPYGQSNFDRIGPLTVTSMPPILSIRSLNSAKLTTTRWLTGMSVYAETVRAASRGPPTWKAVLILLAAVTRDLDAQVARDREVVEPPVVRDRCAGA